VHHVFTRNDTPHERAGSRGHIQAGAVSLATVCRRGIEWRPAMKAALYVRVSTAAKATHAGTNGFVQDPAVQEHPRRELVAQRGWTLYRVYADRASGAKERRPGLDALMADARRGTIDVVVVWRFDRFARSVRQLVLALEEFRSLGVDFISHQEALDTSTPMGKAMFTIIAAMAELERSVIRAIALS